MTDPRKPSPGKTTLPEGWDADDAPPMTESELAAMRPMAEASPETLAIVRRRPGDRGPQKAPTKQAVSIRLDADVIAHFKAGGRGWQSRVNAALRDAMDTRDAMATRDSGSDAAE